MEIIAPPSKSQSGSSASEERVPHFSLCISSLFPPAKSPPGSPHSPERVPHSAPPVHSLFPAANSRSANTETSAEKFSFFSRPHHPAGYQDKAKISRLLFPKKGNNQLSPTAESMHLQFPQAWPGNSYYKEDVPGFQSFPGRTFDLNEYEPNGSYDGDYLHQFSVSKDKFHFPAPSVNQSPPLLEEADKRWSI
ncbi:hypothetical protein SO802_008719 [Lithocarpus litseifolius]|uniref:Uncharacterized protein n=1 Tax=Lithocarpus litseifolius TaxID=425828 RepID=A0AAW2DBL1_9ROSI